MSADGDFMRTVRHAVPPMPIGTFEAIVRSRECTEDVGFIMREVRDHWARDDDSPDTIDAAVAWVAYSPAFEIWVERQSVPVRAVVRDAKHDRDHSLWDIPNCARCKEES